jgi:ribosomal protein bL25 (Ctc-form)
MARIVQLKAARRDRAGKGAARAVRREGLVPGVIYGDKKEPQLVTLGYVDMLQQVQTGRFLSTLVDLEVDGTKVRTIPRDVQFDPVRDFIIHADFLRLGAGARITVEVMVQFRNADESPGIKRGGVLNVVRHEVELIVRPTPSPRRSSSTSPAWTSAIRSISPASSCPRAPRRRSPTATSPSPPSPRRPGSRKSSRKPKRQPKRPRQARKQ